MGPIENVGAERQMLPDSGVEQPSRATRIRGSTSTELRKCAHSSGLFLWTAWSFGSMVCPPGACAADSNPVSRRQLHGDFPVRVLCP